MSLRISTTGAGPDLALIHGWGLGAGVWNGVVEQLTATCRVHRVSLAGYDGTTPDALDFSATAAVIAEALPTGVTLCGWSLGGMLALEAARMRPQAIGRLVLVATSPRFLADADWPHAQASALLEGFSAALARDTKSTLSRFVMLFNQGDGKARAIARQLTPLLNGDLPDTTTLLRGLDWLGEVDLRACLAKIQIPALVIHGDCDPLMPIAAGRHLTNALSNGGSPRMECYVGAAHAPFVAEPDAFSRHLALFCQTPRDPDWYHGRS